MAAEVERGGGLKSKRRDLIAAAVARQQQRDAPPAAIPLRDDRRTKAARTKAAMNSLMQMLRRAQRPGPR